MDDELKTILGVGGAAGGALWKLREPIGNLWQRIVRGLLGRRQQIAVTGMAGVGKSVLLDYLTEEARSSSYEVPEGASLGVEKGTLKLDELRLAASVIPGQRELPQRLDALEDLIESHRVDGVVHLVANGLATVRQPEVRRSYLAQGVTSIAALQGVQRDEEVAEFRQVVEAIRKGRHKGGRPRWLIVAFSKLDLYPAHREAANAWYEYDPASPFAQARREFLADRVPVVTRPLAVRLEPFTWEAETAAPSLGEDERDRLLRELLQTIEQLGSRPEP